MSKFEWILLRIAALFAVIENAQATQVEASLMEAAAVKTALVNLQVAGYVRRVLMQGTRKENWEAHPELIC